MMGFAIALFFIFNFLPVSPVNTQCVTDAEDPLGVRCGAASGLGSTDIRITVARVINIVLGLLGIIALGLILYAGFTWMTSGGNEEKLTTAKKTLWASVIGLIIILSSFAISNFVLGELYRATTNSRTYQG